MTTHAKDRPREIVKSWAPVRAKKNVTLILNALRVITQLITEDKEMKNGPQSSIELPPEDKEPKLPSIMVSLIGNETEDEKQTRTKKQVKFRQIT